MNLPASFHTDESFSNTVDFISYDDFDLQRLKKDGNLKKGSDGMIRYLLIKKLAKNHMLNAENMELLSQIQKKQMSTIKSTKCYPKMSFVIIQVG